MHTLSIFPVLFDFQMIAALVLRLVLGYAIIILVWKEKAGATHFSLESLHGFTKLQICEMIVALFVIVGLFTQVAAMLALVVIVMRWNGHKRSDAPGTPVTTHETLLYIVLTAIALSLLVLGAGFLAFDLPL